MAKDSGPKFPKANTSLAEQAQKLIAEAWRDRETHRAWHQDVYRYCMPWRRRIGATRQTHDQDDLFDSTAIEAVSDFAADMQTAFTPAEDPWLDVEPAETLPDYVKQQITPKLIAYRDAVFAEIRRSNFHEASQESYPDLAAGTCAMTIQDYDLNEPIQCQAVPITDLLIVRGVFGGVDFRCREVTGLKWRDVAPTYPQATLTPQMRENASKNPGNVPKVYECCWRLWDEKGVEKWQYVLLIDGQECENDVWRNGGSNPIMCARWRTDSTTAWGIGALYVVLPTIKTLDQLNYLILKHLSFAVDPAGFYDDDGVINLDNGLQPGDMIPRAAGSKIEPYESEADFNTTFFERKEMQSDIKRALFQDKPEQSGDTPPTLGQWMDQKGEIARRMGAPIGRLTTEWQWAIFQRFAYILERRGQVPQVELNGKVVRLRPQSPLVKAQRQQKVALADRLMQMIQQAFGPQVAPVIIDAIKTAKNLQDQVGDNLVVLRTDDDIQNFVQNLAGVAQKAGLLPPPGGQQPGQPMQPGQAPANAA